MPTFLADLETPCAVVDLDRLALNLDSLGEAVSWVDRQRAIWGRMLDVVEEHAEEQSR